MSKRSLPEIHTAARAIVAKKRGGGLTDPWSADEAATLVRLHAESEQTIADFCRAVPDLPPGNLVRWRRGKAIGGRDWPTLRDALTRSGLALGSKSEAPALPALDSAPQSAEAAARAAAEAAGWLTMGAGDGDGDLFVYGPAPAIRALQGRILEPIEATINRAGWHGSSGPGDFTVYGTPDNLDKLGAYFSEAEARRGEPLAQALPRIVGEAEAAGVWHRAGVNGATIYGSPVAVTAVARSATAAEDRRLRLVMWHEIAGEVLPLGHKALSAAGLVSDDFEARSGVLQTVRAVSAVFGVRKLAEVATLNLTSAELCGGVVYAEGRTLARVSEQLAELSEVRATRDRLSGELASARADAARAREACQDTEDALRRENGLFTAARAEVGRLRNLLAGVRDTLGGVGVMVDGGLK